jgi:GNAT superfamily N-acetyltransferase
MATIRPAGPRDIAQIELIGRSLGYETASSEGVIERILRDPDQILLVATDESDRAVGWLHGVIVSRTASAPFAEIVGLAVDEASHRRGIATVLVEAAAAWAATKPGIDRVRVRVNERRNDAIVFYATTGFTESKRQIVLERRL